jgi:hypothetical protein
MSGNDTPTMIRRIHAHWNLNHYLLLMQHDLHFSTLTHFLATQTENTNFAKSRRCR